MNHSLLVSPDCDTVVTLIFDPSYSYESNVFRFNPTNQSYYRVHSNTSEGMSIAVKNTELIITGYGGLESWDWDGDNYYVRKWSWPAPPH